MSMTVRTEVKVYTKGHDALTMVQIAPSSRWRIGTTLRLRSSSLDLVLRKPPDSYIRMDLNQFDPVRVYRRADSTLINGLGRSTTNATAALAVINVRRGKRYVLS